MKKEVNKTLIGAFIVGAVVLAVAGIMVFGGGSLLKKSNRYALYFSGSVNGLRLGAPVQLKGVPLGKVIQINLVYSDTSKSFFTQVIIDVPRESVKIVGDPDGEGPRRRAISTEANIDDLVEAGLRAKLELQSFVTGMLLVAFDFYPDTPVNLMGFENDLQEFPTLPSDMEALAKTFDAIDFQGIVESFTQAARGIDRLANSPDLHGAVATANDTLERYRQLAVNLDRHVARLTTEMTTTLVDVRKLINRADDQITPMASGITDTAADIRKTVANFDTRLQPVMKNIEETTASARDAFQQAQAMLVNLTYLSEEDSAFIYRVDETMTELRKAAGALTLLADYLGRHPEALLQGKKSVEEGK